MCRELTEQQQKAGKTEYWPNAQGETEGEEEITYKIKQLNLCKKTPAPKWQRASAQLSRWYFKR